MGENEVMKRELAYQAIAEVYRDINLDRGYWTAETVREAERRMAVDDADQPDATVLAADFTLRVLDRLGLVDPYDGPGEHHHPRYA